MGAIRLGELLMTVRQERRMTSRRRVFFGAMIESETLVAPVDCQVRSLGDTGAMLSSLDRQALPARFALRLYGQNRHFNAEIIWRAEGKAGVKFVSTPNDKDRRHQSGANDNGGSRIAELRARFQMQEI